MKLYPLSHSDVFDHLDELVVWSFRVQRHQYVLHILLQRWGCVRIYQFWVNVLVQFHYSHQILLEFLKLPPVCSDHFLLLINDLRKFIYFSCVKIDSVLDIWTLLLVLSLLRLVLILLLNLFYQFSQVLVLLCDLSNRTLIMKMTTVFFVSILLVLDLGVSVIKRKLTALNSWLVSNNHVLNWPLRVSSTVGHLAFLFWIIDVLFIFINAPDQFINDEITLKIESKDAL